MSVKAFFPEDTGPALEKSIFLFSLFYFSQLWRTLARKLMKRPIVFITYFESPFQIVPVYQVFRSGYFFPKFYDGFNIISIFPIFSSFAREVKKRHTNFMTYFQIFYHCVDAHKILWFRKCLLRKWHLFENVNNFLLIFATLSNICDKSYEKTYHFFT